MCTCVRVLACVCARKRRAPKQGKHVRKIERKIGNETQEQEGERDKYTLLLYLLSPQWPRKSDRGRGAKRKQRKRKTRRKKKKKKSISQDSTRWTHFVASCLVLPPYCVWFLSNSNAYGICAFAFDLPSTFYLREDEEEH